MSEKTLIDRIVLADEQGHLQGKPLESVRGAVAEAVPPAVAAEVAKLPKPAAEITPAALAKEMGVWLVYGGAEPEPTKYGVNVVWVDTSNPSAHVPAAPVFSQQAKTIEIPADRGVTYRIDGTPVEAGTSRVTEPFPKTVRVSAIAKSGFTLAVGAQTEWSFTFESVAIPYEDAVLPLTTYFRLDDEQGSTVPRDRGVAPMTLISKYNNTTFKTGGEGIGIGQSSAVVTSSGYVVANYAPSSVKAFTILVAFRVNRSATNAVKLGSLWSTKMPQLSVLTHKGMEGTALSVDFNYPNGGAVSKSPENIPPLKHGDLAVLMCTWDGATIRGVLNGAEFISIPWAGHASGDDPLKLIEWVTQDGANLNIAGLGVLIGEAKTAGWAQAAYMAAKGAKKAE